MTDIAVRVPGIDRAYRWREGWGELPAPADALAWAHPGVATIPSGGVLVVDADEPVVHELDPDGRLLGSRALPVTEGHGITPDPEAGPGWLWVADPGFKLRVRDGERHRDGPDHGRVVLLDDAGTVRVAIDAPPHDAYRHTPFRPTAVCTSGTASDRILWVADGYGASLVHRYRADGTYLGTIHGGPDDLRFQTPHAVFLDDRTTDPALLVTDRVGRRLQAFDLDGRYRGVIGADQLTSPSAIALMGDLLIVAELRASLAVLDPDGRVMGRVGDRVVVADEPDWPNERDPDRGLVRSGSIAPGGFHAPHGLAVGVDGSITVAEFVLGGRLVRLTPQSWA